MTCVSNFNIIQATVWNLIIVPFAIVWFFFSIQVDLLNLMMYIISQ